MTFREAICFGEEKLNTAGIDDAKHDAWLLLTFICKIDRTFYYVHIDEEMSVEQVTEYESVLNKRAEHVPLQYITGEQVFMGIPFRVNDAVLIPRQDTETLVEEALKVIRPGMKVLDMCTGSGCILISILKNIVDVEGYGYDISKQAINIAKENAKLNGVTATFERSDLFEDVSDTFDVIVSNPPYIPTDVIGGLMPEVAVYEPIQALDGGKLLRLFWEKKTDIQTAYRITNIISWSTLLVLTVVSIIFFLHQKSGNLSFLLICIWMFSISLKKTM